MASWVLIPCLDQLFDEFDLIAPKRDKASDGKIGNTAHAQTSSDHNPDETGNVPIHDADKVNEVHAIDVDNNLNAGDLTMEKVVQFLLGRCRSGAEKRLRYIIYNRRIWSASSGWVQKTYTGASPHTEHAHFSASYTTALEASRASWQLKELVTLKLDSDDQAWIGKEIRAVVDDRLRDLPNRIATVFAADEKFLNAVAERVIVGYRIAGTEVPGDPSKYRRNLAQLLGDPWFIAMVGTTMGGDPIPANGFPGQQTTAMQHVVDGVQALTSPKTQG